MTRMMTGLALPSIAPHDRDEVSWLARGCEALLDSAVVVLATWTVVYHACLLLELAVPAAVGLEVAALVACAGVVWWLHRRRADGPADTTSGQVEAEPAPVGDVQVDSASTLSTTVRRRLFQATVGCGVATALLLAVNASWLLVALLWLAAAVSGTAWAVLLLLRTAPDDGRTQSRAAALIGPADTRDTAIAVGWAAALAVLSTFTLWPNPDDLYYVNLSQWVVDHGTYPVRDTIFSNLTFPMSSWPPMASYDALVGTVARLGSVHAATVAYIVVPPLATFLSVLALWRLLRAWQVRALALTLSMALVFLLFDGGFGYAAPGNLFLIRLWQGKVILLCLLVPTLLVYSLRYAERPTWARAGWLFAGGVAAVGLSTTAMFLVPILAVGGAAPLFRRPKPALRGFLATSAYPLATGAFTVAIGGRSADLFGSRELYRFDPDWFGHQIFRDGPLAVIVVAAVLAGVLLVPHPMARVTTGVLTLVTGISFIPGFTHLSYDLVGLGPTLWRVSWVASIAALVGVLAAQTASYFSRRRLQVTGPLVLLVVLVLFGVPIWSERNGVSLSAPLHWQRGRQSVATAQQAIAQVRPGDVILTPQDLAITIDVLTTRVKTVAPRDYFMDYLKGDPAFHFGLRLNLIHFANREGHPTGPQVAKALRVLGVDEVCLPRAAYQRLIFLRSLGYQPVPSTPWYNCVTRP
jgi:Family of unknown function (DUF6077)